MDKEELILTEYNVLHAQILGIQSRRDNLASITVSANTTIYGLFFTLFSSEHFKELNPQTVLTAFTLLTYMFVLPAIVMMRSHQQHMRRIVNYIATNIETQVTELKWSSRGYKGASRTTSKNGLKSMGNLYIALSLMPVIYSLFITPKWWFIFVLAACAILATAEALDIRMAYRKSWKNL